MKDAKIYSFRTDTPEEFPHAITTRSGKIIARVVNKQDAELWSVHRQKSAIWPLIHRDTAGSGGEV
jgi:hypothetical protein